MSRRPGRAHVEFFRSARLGFSALVGTAALGLLILGSAPAAATVNSYSTVVLGDSPVAYWRVGEPSGATSATDAGPNHYNATYNNVSLGTDGALVADGDTAATFASNSSAVSWNLLNPTTVEAWVSTLSTSASTIVSGTDACGTRAEWSLQLDDHGHVIGQIDGGTFVATTTTAATVNDGDWHHIVVVLSSSSASTIYIDGVAVTSTYTGLNRPGYEENCPSDPTPTVAIGGAYVGGLDEIALYNAALSAAQVVAHFDAARPWGDSQTDPNNDPADPTPGVAAPSDALGDTDPGSAPTQLPQAATTSSVSVSRTAVVNYALQYVGTQRGTDSSLGWNNTGYPGPPGNDCQDFVSQALRAGGWPDDIPFGADILEGTNVWWYTDPPDHSLTWTVSSYFWRYAQQSGRGGFVSYWNDLQPGDVVFVDWYGQKGFPTHSMVVTAVSTTQTGATQVYLTYHTRNRKNMPMTTLRTEFKQAHWWLFHVNGS